MTETKHTERGFTLVETLVAVAILGLALTGPLIAASNGLNNAFFARDQIVATFLAQEGVELIRAIRDTNSANGFWLQGLTGGFCDTGNGCIISRIGGARTSACGNEGCPVLQFNELRGVYHYNESTGEPSRFTRTIKLSDVSADYAHVQVDVSWQASVLGRMKTVTIETDITNWQDAFIN